MAFLFADSFETITVAADLSLRGWATTGTATIDTVVFKDGTQSLSMNSNETAAWDVGVGLGFVGFGYLSFWFRFDYDTPDSKRHVVLLLSNASAVLAITMNVDRTVHWQDSSSITISGDSPVLEKDRWYHFELQWKLLDSVAATDCVLKIDGVDAINVTVGKDTLLSTFDTIDGFSLRSPAIAGQINFYDSPVFWDSEAGDEWNNYKGQIRIETKAPDANGPDNDFVGSDSNSVDNYLQVDEINTFHDADTTFNDGSTDLDQDSYNFPAIVESNLETILGVQVAMVSEKTTGGSTDLTPFFVDGGSEQLGTEHVLTNGTYTFGSHFWDENPDSSSAWTAADITDGDFGVRVT